MMTSCRCDSSVNLACKIVQHGGESTGCCVNLLILAVDLSTLGSSSTLALPLTV
uniref:Uncharacterized protein n=1 Tax=Arundo donax TaxID=35708 RepID=A0A0A9FKH5_ARUDO